MSGGVKQKNRFRPLVLAAVLAGMLCVPVSADFGYNGPLNVETGAPLGSDGSDDPDAYSDRVYVTDGVYYDRTRQGYLYSVGSSSAQVLCTVADGMVVRDDVEVIPDDGVEVTVYRDGTALEEPDLTHIQETGDYTVEAVSNGQTAQVVHFSIVGERTNRLARYSMPSGFIVTGVTLNDQTAAYQSSFVDMTQEGHYVINYRCARNGLDYELDVTVDTTPPTLELAAVDDKNQARGPVSLADIEEGDSIGITLDGQQIDYTSELTQSGEYHIVLMDQAGNVTEYQFTILLYFDMNSMIFLSMVAAVLAAVGVYIFVSRKRLEVR